MATRITTAQDVIDYGIDEGQLLIENSTPYSVEYESYDSEGNRPGDFLGDLPQLAGLTFEQLASETVKCYINAASNMEEVTIDSHNIGVVKIIFFRPNGTELPRMNGNPSSAARNSTRLTLGGRGFHVTGNVVDTGFTDLKGHDTQYAFSRRLYGAQFTGNVLNDEGSIIKVEEDTASSPTVYNSYFKSDFCYVGQSGFACFLIKNDDRTKYITVEISNTLTEAPHSEIFYISNTSNGSADGISGFMRNNRSFNSATEMYQTGGLARNPTTDENFTFENNVGICSSTHWRSPFLTGQNGLLQISPRFGRHTFKKSIALGCAANAPNIRFFYDTDDDGLRQVDDALIFEDMVVGFVGQGAYLNNGGDTPPDDESIMPIVFNRCTFIHYENDWWETGSLFSQNAYNYQVTATDCKIYNCHPNIVRLFDVHANYTETGTIVDSDIGPSVIPNFVRDGLTEKGYSYDELEQWGNWGLELNNKGDTDVALPTTINIATLLSSGATFEGKKNKFAADYQIGDEMVFMVNAGFADTIKLDPVFWCRAVITNVVNGADLANPDKEVTITVDVPTSSEGLSTGTYDDWSFSRWQVDVRKPYALKDFVIGDLVCDLDPITHEPYYFKALTNHHFVNPHDEITVGSATADSDLETKGANWALIWWDNEGTPTTEPPLDLKLHSNDQYAAQSMGLTDAGNLLTIEETYNRSDLIRTMRPEASTGTAITGASLISGEFPTGISLNTSNGQISGTIGAGAEVKPHEAYIQLNGASGTGVARVKINVK